MLGSWCRYDKDGKNALNWDDIGAMVKGNANAGDPFGWTAGALAWLTLLAQLLGS